MKEFFNFSYRKKKIFIIVIISILFLLVLGLFMPFIVNRPALIPEYNFVKYKEIAQSFGAYLSPFIALIAAFLTFLAFYVQYQSNESIRNQFDNQSVTDHFYKMLDIHIGNIKDLSINTYRNNTVVKYDVDNGKVNDENFSFALNFLVSGILTNYEWKKTNSYKEVLENLEEISFKASNEGEVKECEARGRKVFLLIEKDFHYTHYFVALLNKKLLDKKLKNYQVNELAYKIFFWGTNSRNIYGSNIEKSDVEIISRFLNEIRKRIRRHKGQKVLYCYKTHQKKRDVSFRFIPFSGHASRLAHYYRHLYQTVKFLDTSYKNKLISKEQLDNMLNTLRAQLSNEEVLLLYYNYRIGFGSNWDYIGKNEYEFLTEYRMLHNIPLTNIIPKSIENPEAHFILYIANKVIIKKKYIHFEWGHKMSHKMILDKIVEHFKECKNEKFLKREKESLKNVILRFVRKMIENEKDLNTKIQVSFCDDANVDFSQMLKKVYLIDLGNCYRIKAIYAIDMVKLKNDSEFKKERNLRHFINRRLKTDLEIYKLKDFQ